jgi:type I restriction enzyme M protein
MERELMAGARFDLISMADIARLAGQTRATVGNWKARNPDDFPAERGRGSRGPLYDRAEVTAWLESTNRLDERPPEVTAMWHLADQLRDGMTTEDTMPLLLVLLAVMSKASASEWQRVLDSQSNDLDATVRAAAAALFPFANEVLPTGKLPAQAVARAIDTLSSLDRPRVAVMADALLEQAASAMGRKGGEFLSPPSVRRLVVAIADPTGTVYNPATGVGQLMIDAATNAASQPVQLFGQEINARIWAMSQLNLAIHDVTAEIALGDVFAEDHYPQLRADRVISVPPWNQRLPIADVLTGDPRWVWGEPGPNDGNAGWTQHCLSHLADGGRAVIVLPNGALFEGGRAGRIRQRIVKAGLLDAVFALPPGLFAWTGLPCSVLVFTKGRRNVDGKPAPTLMVDLTESTEVPGSRSAALDSDLIDEVVELYGRWVDGKQPTEEYAAVAAFDDLAANDFVIDPGRYLSLPHTAPDLEKAAHKRANLVDRLESLTRASSDADARLKAILETRR